MSEIPEEYIVRSGIKRASEYFAEIFMEKRMSNRVPVLIEDFTTAFYFVECDRHGYPMRKYTDYLAFVSFPKLSSWEKSDPVADESTCIKKTIEVERPLIVFNEGSSILGQPYVFMWQGRLVDKAEVPIDELDVKKLLKLAQEAVQKREGIIIDEVLKNKLIR